MRRALRAALAAFGAVEEHPRREVVGEADEAVRSVCRDEQYVTGRDFAFAAVDDEARRARGDRVDLVARMRLLLVVDAWPVQLDVERTVAKQRREQRAFIVEAGERQKNSQLARDVEIALPRELSKAEAVALAREYVAEQFVSRGMVVDLNVHWGVGADGGAQPHAHAMLTMRRIETYPTR